MKRSSKLVILAGVAVVSMNASIFGKSLGLPDFLASILMLLGVVCSYMAIRTQRRVKPQAAGAPTSASPRRVGAGRIWLIVGCLAAGCAIFPFVSRYEGVTLPFPEVALISLVTFFICSGIAVFALRRK